jgi:hypothetical protein
MEIRALTGFEKSTRKQYGRSYSPLNGVNPNNTLLGMGNTFKTTFNESERGVIMDRFNIPNLKASDAQDMYNIQDRGIVQNPYDVSKASKPATDVKQSFFKKYKTPLIVAGGLAAAFVIYKQLRK